jgi:hypothetical protein
MTYLVYQMQQNPALDTAALNALAAEGWQIIFTIAPYLILGKPNPPM